MGPGIWSKGPGPPKEGLITCYPKPKGQTHAYPQYSNSTSFRGAVRALVKAHGAWQGFITSKGKLSAQALNADLIEFALKYPDLTARVEALLSASVAPYDPSVDNDAADDMGAPDWPAKIWSWSRLAAIRLPKPLATQWSRPGPSRKRPGRRWI